jgi:hypothetical protein
VVVAVAETLKWDAAAVPTAMLPLVPVIELVTVSVAVTVWLPTVARVTPLVKVWTPLSAAVKVKYAGSYACPTLIENCTFRL